jgi:hypothetical protein
VRALLEKIWLPVRVSRHTGLDPASRILGYTLQPHINPDSDKNFGNEYDSPDMAGIEYGVPAPKKLPCHTILDYFIT